MTIHLIRDLDRLQTDILTMAARVVESVAKAVSGLSDPDPALAQALSRDDMEVDRMDVHVEEACLKILALHQPVASDLRRIATVLRITNELERVADLAVNISERVAGLASHPAIPVPGRLLEMAQTAIGMLERSIKAYAEMDGALAAAVRADDDKVDDLNREMIAELGAVMHASPDHVEPALDLISASKNLERIADHATNIAKDVQYLVGGQITRHRSKLQRDAG